VTDINSSRTAARSNRITAFSPASGIGAAWSRTSKNGGAYLFLKLTDPSQPDPVLCNLYRNASGPAVLWAR
jgi:uncharacterized protein (DUF736 family)